MLKLETDPEALEPAAYVARLNACFPRSWSRELFDWYLARPFAGRRPDRLVLSRNGEPVAGSGINYRSLRAPGGDRVDVGIATGTWTLPSERGRGHFARMMRESAELAASRGCPLFLGFVTEDNPSCRGLARLGATLLPSYYIHAAPEDSAPDPTPEVQVVEAPPPARPQEADTAATRFHYASEADWRAQFLERPYPVECLSIGRGCTTLVERAEDTDRLLWISGSAPQRTRALAALVSRARHSGRRFFLFSTDPWAARAAQQPGLHLQTGAVGCLVAAGAEAKVAAALASPWEIHGGDRM